MSRLSPCAVLVALAACGAGFLCRPGLAAGAPLPVVPKMVMELYLPEERAACRSGYAMYSTLPDDVRGRLHAGTKDRIAVGKLSPATRTRLAAWFDSARWGCDPPAEKLDAEAVAKSTLLLTYEEGVVELALQSPEHHLWKKLAIACAPGKAEWVRDGLPLLPHWTLETWAGGAKPPDHAGERAWARWWPFRRAVYAVYADLSAAQLRQLHRAGALKVEFARLPSSRQESIARAIDTFRLNDNRQSSPPRPAAYGRPPDAIARRFGITALTFTYQTDPMAAPAIAASPDGVNVCPRPFKTVSVTIATPYPKGTWQTQGDLIAMPPQLQRELLAWRSKWEAWKAKWTVKSADGTVTVKDGAPASPRFP